MKISSIFTPDKLARRLGITVQTLLSWKRFGLPLVKIGKFSFVLEESFLKWVKSRESAQDAPEGEEGENG